MLNILCRIILTWGVKPGHPGNPQNYLSNLPSHKVQAYELLRQSTLTLKVL